MRQLISFHKPKPEWFEGRKVMTDPGIHCAIADEVAKRIAPRSRILEIGAGAGAFSTRLHKMGYAVHAVDIDGSVFHVPEVSFTKVEPEDNLSDIFSQNDFDAIVAIEVMEHLRSTWEFFNQAAKLLVPGGHIFLTTPNLCSFYGRIVFLKEGRFFHFQGEDSWKMGHINPMPFFVIEQGGYPLEASAPCMLYAGLAEKAWPISLLRGSLSVRGHLGWRNGMVHMRLPHRRYAPLPPHNAPLAVCLGTCESGRPQNVEVTCAKWIAPLP